MHNAGLLPRIDSLAASLLSAGRYRHSVSTAELARALCLRFKEAADKGTLAGLAHDAARELPSGQIVRLCLHDGLNVTGTEARDPVLLHGRAAAALLTLRAGLWDEDTLQAVRDHVTGRPSMGRLSRILFCADLLEPCRKFLSDSFRRRTLALELDAMTLEVLRIKAQYVRSRRMTVSPSSTALMEELGKNA